MKMIYALIGVRKGTTESLIQAYSDYGRACMKRNELEGKRIGSTIQHNGELYDYVVVVPYTTYTGPWPIAEDKP